MYNSSYDSAPQNNAMTEIALALAMGFFSIMVLTMVSMSVEKTPKEKLVKTLAAPLAQTAKANSNPGVVEPTSDDLIVIFDGNRFLDRNLKALNPASLDPSRRIILAINPKVQLEQALQARAQITSAKVMVSSLDAKWQAALKRINSGSN